MSLWPTGGLWRHADFLKLWSAQAISAVGSRVTRTALPVIAVLSVDGSPTELGVLSALMVGPGALVGMLAGGTIDRNRKRPLLIGADWARALLVLFVPIAAWLGVLAMWQLYLVAALVGAASALFQITDNTYLPALIGTEHLLEGNSKLESTEAIAEIAGPGLGGVLIQLLTAPIAMLIDAVTYVISALLLTAIRVHETPSPGDDGATLRSDLKIGIRACLDDAQVRAILFATAISTFFTGAFFALYMLFTLDTLGLSPAAVGLVIGCGGVGALFGAVIAPRMARALGTGRALLLCMLLGQAGSLLIPLAGGPRAVALSLLVAHQLIGDAFMVAFFVLAVSWRQTRLPLATLGRANATFHVVTSALLPLGSLIAGGVGTLIGVRETLWIGVVGGMLAPIALLGLRGVREVTPPS